MKKLHFYFTVIFLLTLSSLSALQTYNYYQPGYNGNYNNGYNNGRYYNGGYSGYGNYSGYVYDSSVFVDTDQGIARTIREAFLADSFLAPYPVTVSVTNGVAILSGTVPDIYIKTQFDSKASGISGVTKVINNIATMR